MRQPKTAGSTGVVIRGSGVAARATAHLLRKGGIPSSILSTHRPRLPALMLSEGAIALMREVLDQPGLLSGAHRITKRIVAWGRGAEPRVFSHSAVVASEGEVLEALSGHIPEHDGEFGAHWMVVSSKPAPGMAKEQRFGSRMAVARRVILEKGADASACWIESLERGWLFLIPNRPDSAWVLAVGAALEESLAESRIIRKQVAALGGAMGKFPAYPRILSPLCSEGWLACGTAAMAFDPICGDGTAHAVREAILAAAVIRASIEGEDLRPLLAHYEHRLTAGFARHLSLCREFYKSGGGGTWWDAEVASLQAGLEWCALKFRTAPPFRYRLDGFELQAAS